MESFNKALATILTVILIVSSLLIVPIGNAQSILSPSEPEFTVTLQSNNTILLKIKNQPFTPYSINSTEINLYYRVRTKLHNAGDEAWYERYGGFDSNYGFAKEYPKQSDSEYTNLSLSLFPTNPLIDINDGKWDIQVKAQIGNISLVDSELGFTYWVFDGKKSDWSNQTITISPSSSESSLSSDLLWLVILLLVTVVALSLLLFHRRRRVSKQQTA
jgi:hypothetical protein